MTAEKRQIGFFEKYLTLWVALGILGGIAIGHLAGDSMAFISNLEIARVNIPVAILIWLMIYPMMLQVDFSSIKKIGKRPKGVVLTLVVNWLIKPFTMAFFAWLFFSKLYQAWITPEMAGEYIAGAIILGAAPCTAMVFVWSYLTNGDPNYTLVQTRLHSLGARVPTGRGLQSLGRHGALQPGQRRHSRRVDFSPLTKTGAKRLTTFSQS